MRELFDYWFIGIVAAAATLGGFIYYSFRSAKMDHELWHPYILLTNDVDKGVRDELFQLHPEIVTSFFDGDSPADFKEKYADTFTELYGPNSITRRFYAALRQPEVAEAEGVNEMELELD